MKKLILLTVLFISSTAVFAQLYPFKVNGLTLGEKYTTEQIIAALGQSPDIDDEDVIPGWVSYRYVDNKTGKPNDFLFIYNYFQVFDIRGKDYKLSNLLEIGMDASVIESMGGVIYGVEPDMFYWAPSVDKKGKEFLQIFRDPATNKMTLISANIYDELYPLI